MTIKDIVIEKERLSSEELTAVSAAAARFKCEINLAGALRKINLKSIMGVLSMNMKKGDRFIVEVIGEDEEAAAECIAAMLTAK